MVGNDGPNGIARGVETRNPRVAQVGMSRVVFTSRSLHPTSGRISNPYDFEYEDVGRRRICK